MRELPRFPGRLRVAKALLGNLEGPGTEEASAGRVIAKKTPSALELKTFRKLSTEFFANETPRDYVAELSLFILITGIAAWPIISSMVAITRLVRKY
jgi:hypothetical protein